MKNLFDYTGNPLPGEIERMIKDGADVNARNDKGYTSFMMASCYGYERCARTLISLGANPDLQDKHGNTALILAAYAGMTSSVSLILELGADPSIKDKSGHDAMDAMDENPHLDKEVVSQIAKLLSNAGIKREFHYIKGIRIPSLIDKSSSM